MVQQRRTAEIEEQRRLAAEEANAMPDPSSQEQAALHELFDKYQLTEENIRPDGNCLYAAFASQLNYGTINKVNICNSQLI
jgi:OTU domain-containing protein 6